MIKRELQYLEICEKMPGAIVIDDIRYGLMKDWLSMAQVFNLSEVVGQWYIEHSAKHTEVADTDGGCDVTSWETETIPLLNEQNKITAGFYPVFEKNECIGFMRKVRHYGLNTYESGYFFNLADEETYTFSGDEGVFRLYHNK